MEEAELAEYLNDPRFSRNFELPADPAHGRESPFKIRYADFGYRNESHPEQENVLLFFSPLFGSRLLHIAKDELAKRHKVRIISVDRPGVGGTDAVDPARSMAVWRG
jgi:pimeloyl-ACP methyl ester carboxylesterase